MSVKNAMFIFEVVMESIKSLVESRQLVVKADFADIFSLVLKDPKKMNIVMPEPLPPPPEPLGKKGKKKKKKPKPKKGKKGKKGLVEEVPPEPAIQAGQSVLFASSAEVLKQTMEKLPLEFSLWNKEENLEFIGATRIPWDPIFLAYLQKLIDCEETTPVMLKEGYNIFQEGTGKLMATIYTQVSLYTLNDKVTTAFRTLSEDENIRKCLYTGINSKTTSFICTMKTTDEVFDENINKTENCYTVDKPPPKSRKVVYADYKNAAGANLTSFNDGDICCYGHIDKPPDSKYRSPETCPSIDFIIDYVRKIIVSCNDNMRMLTPQPTLRPRIKATNIDRLCYCQETDWPDSQLAKRFKHETQAGPCPLCIDDGKKYDNNNKGTTFDIANIRGPCGKADCRIARDMRAYLENLVEEDNVEFNINDVIGPCGSKHCTVAEKIQEFLRREGEFTHGATHEGLSTQCACLQKMQESVNKRESCASFCSKECSDSSSDHSNCRSKDCPYVPKSPQIYNVYYFTVEHDTPRSSSKPPSTKTSKSSRGSSEKNLLGSSANSSVFKYCAPNCPSVVSEKTSCSKTTCSYVDPSKHEDSKCVAPVCSNDMEYIPSPADSNVVIEFAEIQNPCCVESCDVADRIKDLIVDSELSRKNKNSHEDNCYCDCVCDFNFSRNTTYCAVCGGFESLGDDVKAQPEYMQPHPCPVYHKLYDKKYIKVKSPWPEDEAIEQSQKESLKVTKGIKAGSSEADKKQLSGKTSEKVGLVEKVEKKVEKQPEHDFKPNKKKEQKKKVGKFTSNIVKTVKEPSKQSKIVDESPQSRYLYPYPAVPKHMGWNWNAPDIPGMKPHPRQWKPGAVHKRLVRKYRALREGVDVAKKKRAMMQRKKKIEMKPTLVVTKHKYGEYTVQMEVFKKYSKERLPFQYPYDEKPPLIYTIGKTDAERREIKKQRDRKERRETRRKNRLLQSTFRDKCQEICLKAYNQALGLYPLPNPNDPECPCQTQKDPRLTPPIDSCSCSDAGTISSSDSDNDEWVIEFTPPVAKWDPKTKHSPAHIDNEAQYNYLDFKVKLLDKSGNLVPRYFKGPDGKQECSDLGGFWGPNKVWLEINKDGYIGPDGRWIPQNFTGPDGLPYSAEEGFFTDSTGRTLKIGVDGWIDKESKWVWYSKGQGNRQGARSIKSTATGTATMKSKREHLGKGDGKSKVVLSSPGVIKENKIKLGDKKLDITYPPIVKHRQVDTVSLDKKNLGAGKGRDPIVMNVLVNYNRNKQPLAPSSSRKPYMDPKKLEKYREIMDGLQMYEDLGKMGPPAKTNRACNTVQNRVIIS